MPEADTPQLSASPLPPAEDRFPVVSKIVEKTHSLVLTWSDGFESEYHYLWLRDNCPSGFHADTHERTFDLLSVSEDIHPLSVTLNQHALVISWSEQGHTSSFHTDWLREKSYSNGTNATAQSRYQSWDSTFLTHIPKTNYADVVSSDKSLYEWMQQLEQYGLTLAENVPNSAEATIAFANRIDYLRQTNFGTTFDVISVEKPNNLAYTDDSLPVHTDLPNQEIPPGYQFLHCLANECEGGESTFVDGLRVAEELRSFKPEQFKLLCEHAVPFRFYDKTHDILHRHPIINLDSFGNIVEIKYNAHLSDVFDIPADAMFEFYRAYRSLMKLLRDERFKIEIKLEKGQMVIFDNRRVLHGRNRFESNSGSRRLHGCYVDRTEFNSRLTMLQRKFSIT